MSDYLDRYMPRSGDLLGEAAQQTDLSGRADGGGDGGGDDGADACGYLAQHPLFEQIPSLRDDIRTPRFCTARASEDESAPDECERRIDPLVSAWIGPAGTVSPLHNDPYHNLLAQVVGHKYIRLYDAKHTPRLYPRSGPLCNNSHVNLDAPRPEKQPLVESTPFHQCILRPGKR